MSARLLGHRIAILADDGVDSDELRKLWRTFTDHGAEVRLSSIQSAELLAVDTRGAVDRFSTDQLAHHARTEEHSALVVPNGRGPHWQLRYHRRVASLARATVSTGKVLATANAAAAMLVAAGVARRRHVTSTPHLRTELEAAGAYWNDVAVAQDRGVVTARRPGAELLAAAVLNELSMPDPELVPFPKSMCEPPGRVVTTQ